MVVSASGANDTHYVLAKVRPPEACHIMRNNNNAKSSALKHDSDKAVGDYK